MPTFSWAESPGTALEETPRVASTRFGDGYEECAPDGLNPLAQAWTLQFRRVSRSGGDAIVAFLRARVSAVGGLEAFDWWPLWATAAIKVRCRGWTRTQLDEAEESDITARFERVHLP